MEDSVKEQHQRLRTSDSSAAASLPPALLPRRLFLFSYFPPPQSEAAAQTAPTDGAGVQAAPRPAPPQPVAAAARPRSARDTRLSRGGGRSAQGPSGKAPRVGPDPRGPAAPGGVHPSASPWARGRPRRVRRRRSELPRDPRAATAGRSLTCRPPPPPPSDWQPREPMRRALERLPANPDPREVGRGAPARCAAPLAAPRAQRPSPQRIGAAAAADRADGRTAGPPYPRHRRPARLNLTCRPPPSGGGGSESSGCASHSNREISTGIC
ncbi:proline-rich protein HaeIII subfamily 1-like [Phasianus colchicus]|uniref:proline-rich protein HaeIII subfamily 1-like n=1 Tax=Phasianus colchicus TaxID=9054 RepID=UPI00129E7FBB|nr:proline-rich protein HaeIII subfamily 1-like [Phasianus colchicus]